MVAVVVPWRRRWDLASAIVGEAVARCVTTSFALRPERVLCIPNVSQPFSVVRRHVKVERRDVASQLTCSVTAIVHRSVSKAAHKIVGMIAYSFGGKRKKKTEKKIKKSNKDVLRCRQNTLTIAGPASTLPSRAVSGNVLQVGERGVVQHLLNCVQKVAAELNLTNDRHISVRKMCSKRRLRCYKSTCTS